MVGLKATKPEAPTSPPEERTWLVETARVAVADVQPILQLYGTVASGRSVDLRALVGGTVETVGAAYVEGGIVNKGELLVAIDPFVFRQTLVEQNALAREARARLRELEARQRTEAAMLAEDQQQVALSARDLARREKLVGDAVSEKSLDDARAALSRAKIEALRAEQGTEALDAQIQQQQAVIERLGAVIARAERDMADTRLSAPFDGYVATPQAEIGQRLNPGDPVARLIDSNRLEARVFVSNAQLGRLVAASQTDPGTPVTVLWRTGDRVHALDGAIARIGSEIDATSGGAYLYAHLRDVPATLPLRPGAFVEVRLQDQVYPNVTRLPQTAVHGTGTVYAVMEQRLEPRSVEVVAREDDMVIVRGALAEGDEVVVTRFAEIGPGVKVATAQ